MKTYIFQSKLCQFVRTHITAECEIDAWIKLRIATSMATARSFTLTNP